MRKFAFLMVFLYFISLFFFVFLGFNPIFSLIIPFGFIIFILGRKYGFSGFISYGIPLLIVLYVLYMNFLPFGYEKEFVLEADGGSSELSFESGFSDVINGSYREIEGVGVVNFDPKFKLNEGIVEVEIVGDAYILAPNTFNSSFEVNFSKFIDDSFLIETNDSSYYEQLYNMDKEVMFDYEAVKEASVSVSNPMDYHNYILTTEPNMTFDFSKKLDSRLKPSGIPLDMIDDKYQFYLDQGEGFDIWEDDGTHPLSIDFSKGVPKFFNREAIIRNNSAYFNGQFRLIYPDTEKSYETDAFAVYVEWTPEDNESSFQQIVGHYNWEIAQFKDKVEFFVKTKTDNNKQTYKTDIKVSSDFFNKKHKLLAIYNPKGFIELMVDDKSVRKDIGENKIFRGYGEYPLRLGKSMHGSANYFKGYIHKIEIIDGIDFFESKIEPVFDGFISYSLADSKDLFENESFAVYAKWTPEDNKSIFQQIVGHYNWEILQYPNKVRFQIGRMNNKSGPFYNVEYKIDSSFFDKTHRAVALYDVDDESISFSVDGIFAGRKDIGQNRIWVDYGNKDLSFGKSSHGSAEYFVGDISEVSLFYPKKFSENSDVLVFPFNYSKDFSILLDCSGNGPVLRYGDFVINKKDNYFIFENKSYKSDSIYAIFKDNEAFVYIKGILVFKKDFKSGQNINLGWDGKNFLDGEINDFKIYEVEDSLKMDFNGTTRISLKDSKDLFENSFVGYVEWTPKDSENKFQQIVGHYNWELVQYPGKVHFQVGRMFNKTGPFFSISYSIDDKFFNKKHKAFFIYEARDYIALFVDDIFVGGKYLKNYSLWKDYGDKDLSFGKSMHSSAKYFKGQVDYFNIGKQNLTKSFKTNDISKIIIVGKQVEEIKVNYRKK